MLFKFLLFSFALGVIFSKNPVHSVLYLILVFLNSSFLLLLIGAEFIAILLIVVYVGAISILFLFIVMMLNIRLVELYSTFFNYMPIVIFVIIIYFFFFGIFFYTNYTFINNLYFPFEDFSFLLFSKTNIFLFGEVFYNYYVHYLLMSSILLLIAMIGSITLTVFFSVSNQKSAIKSNTSFILYDLEHVNLSFWGFSLS